ncbi:MAG: RimK family alpha-L-glutamate ligase [Clostridia bacterium]|nr:RimK family alpha-L-glutamate ligase [Clostridia bacterium]
MKKCAIIINGFYTNPSIEHQVSSLKSEFFTLGVSAEVVKSGSVLCFIEGNGVRLKSCGYDFAVYFDKDVHTALMLEKGGLRLFNSAKSIALCDDKMLTFIALSESGIRMPKTISSPVMYRPVTESAFLCRVEEEMPYPVVVKEVYGSMGAGVHLAKNREELAALRESLKLTPHVYQKFIGKGGEDKRIITVGGKAVASMLRVNEKDFRSNVACGGIGISCGVTEEEKFIAERASEVLGLDYAGIDVITDENGTPYLCEVNSNAFFLGIQQATGVNVGGLFARRVYGEVYGRNA